MSHLICLNNQLQHNVACFLAKLKLYEHIKLRYPDQRNNKKQPKLLTLTNVGFWHGTARLRHNSRWRKLGNSIGKKRKTNDLALALWPKLQIEGQSDFLPRFPQKTCNFTEYNKVVVVIPLVSVFANKRKIKLIMHRQTILLAADKLFSSTVSSGCFSRVEAVSLATLI